MDTEWNKNAPIIASPAAIGFGPSVAMPALLGMMPEFTDLDDEMDEEGKEDRDEDDMMRYLEGLSPQVGTYSQREDFFFNRQYFSQMPGANEKHTRQNATQFFSCFFFPR